MRQQFKHLGDVGGDAPGLVAGELGPRQRLPAHGEKMLAYKAEKRLGSTGETMRRREFIALVGASVTWPFAAMAQQAGADLSSGFLGTQPAQIYAPTTMAFSTDCDAAVSLKAKTSRSNIAHYGQHVDLIPQYAAELVNARVDVIVSCWG